MLQNISYPFEFSRVGTSLDSLLPLFFFLLALLDLFPFFSEDPVRYYVKVK